jgi:hypothetical protein
MNLDLLTELEPERNVAGRTRLQAVPAAAGEPCTAETADCTCPDFCERDHANE